MKSWFDQEKKKRQTTEEKLSYAKQISREIYVSFTGTLVYITKVKKKDYFICR